MWNERLVAAARGRSGRDRTKIRAKGGGEVDKCRAKEQWDCAGDRRDIYQKCGLVVRRDWGMLNEAGFVRRGRGVGAGTTVFGNSWSWKGEYTVIGRRDARELD